MASKAERLAAAVDDILLAVQSLAVATRQVVDELREHPEFVAAMPEPSRIVPPQQQPAPQAAAEPAASLTLDELRAIVSRKSQAGFREQIKALLTSYGVERLPDLDPACYAEFLATVEAMSREPGNG